MGWVGEQGVKRQFGDPTSLGAKFDRQWSVTDVAAHLGVKPRTVTAYLARKQMPTPDGRLGRTPWWWETTIRSWRP